jgi:predicted PurR-regulated permease PerM
MEGFGRFMSSAANFFLMFFVYLYSLFFFIKDGPNILKGLMTLVPLPLDEKKVVVDNFTNVTRASLKGIFVIGLLQGFIGGLLFMILGLPSPVIFGVLFLILAAIPNFGAVLIWLPTGIILLFSGEIVKGIIMLTLGGLIIAAVDYLVRPRIIKGGTSVHEILVLIGIFGGLAVFGVFGFIIGPIIMAVFKEILKIFSSRYHDEIHQI